MKPAIGFSVAKKKTPFQRHKEAEEEKKRKAEEEAAKVYEEFVESFAGEEPPQPDHRGRPFRDGPPSASRGPRGGWSSDPLPPPPPPPPPGSGSSSRGTSRHAAGFSDKPKPKAFDDDDEAEPDAAQLQLQAAKKPEKEKPRQIDLMLERLKQEQQEREEREAARRDGRSGDGFHAAPSFEELGAAPGSYDSGDPFTTNLYLGNLAPDVDENVLIKEFGRFGAIGSVKVMWPRDEEQRRKGRNSGFVAFMKREDAAKALDAMDGVVLHDFELRVGWGRAVTLPVIPVWAGPDSGKPLAPMAGQNTARPGFAPQTLGATVPPPLGLVGAAASAAMPWSSGAERRQEPRGPHDGVGPDIEVPIIEDLHQRFLIDSLAMYVVKDGAAFEQLIMEEERGNPEFAFLFDLASPEHIYYRWRVYSLCEGDSLRTWRIEPFVMVEGGQRWLAPSMTAMVLSAGTNAGRSAAPVVDRVPHSHERPLSGKERDRFEDMLRTLTVERADIKAAMTFALDSADAGAEVVDTLADALSLPETPMPQKIARLFLVSDILHNSTAPVRNASRYRGRFEAALPAIFEALQQAYRAVETRITQEALRRHVLRVLRCWRERFVFTDDFLNGLQATFLQPPSDLATLAAANPGLSQQLSALGPEELERKCRLGGLATKGGRDAQMYRLLALDAYLNSGGTGGVGDVKPAAVVVPAEVPELSRALEARDTPLDIKPERRSEEPEVKPAPLVSRWTSIDAAEEQAALPAVPISKWLAQETEQEKQREAAAAAAAAAVEAAAAAAASAARAVGIFSDDDSGDAGATAAATPAQGAPSAAAIATTPSGGAMDEARRQRLRQVELQCARLESELEEHGVARSDIETRVAAKRMELLAAMEGRAGAVSGNTPAPAAAATPDRAATVMRWRSRGHGATASGGNEAVDPLPGATPPAGAAANPAPAAPKAQEPSNKQPGSIVADARASTGTSRGGESRARSHSRERSGHSSRRGGSVSERRSRSRERDRDRDRAAGRELHGSSRDKDADKDTDRERHHLHHHRDESDRKDRGGSDQRDQRDRDRDRGRSSVKRSRSPPPHHHRRRSRSGGSRERDKKSRR